jgi:predicted DNA-binding protein YlxM (UPF0122 family)
MLKLNKKQIEEIESLSELQFSPDEIATIIQVDQDAFKQTIVTNDSIKTAYNRGRLKADAAVRKAILEQAKQGSTPAQKQMLELINQAKEQTAKKTRPIGRDSDDLVPF